MSALLAKNAVKFTVKVLAATAVTELACELGSKAWHKVRPSKTNVVEA